MIKINIFIKKRGLIFPPLVKHVCPVLRLLVFLCNAILSNQTFFCLCARIIKLVYTNMVCSLSLLKHSQI